MRNRTVEYFIGKLTYLLSKNPKISNIHSLVILALRNQNHSNINEFYLDCAIKQLKVQRALEPKKVIQKPRKIKEFSIAA